MCVEKIGWWEEEEEEENPTGHTTLCLVGYASDNASKRGNLISALINVPQHVFY